MNPDHREELLVAERAAKWLHRLQTAGPQEQMAFVRWLKKSPRHVHEMLLATTWDESLQHIDPDHRLDVHALAAQFSNNVVPMQPGHPVDAGRLQDGGPLEQSPNNGARKKHVVHFRGLLRRLKPSTPRSRDRRPWTLAAAFLVITLIPVLTLMLTVGGSDRSMVTDASEWHTRMLADGSVVRLGPRTRLRIEFSDGRRVIHFSRGEAVFRVAKDPLRPFFVDTELALVRAVGTEFGVSRVIDTVVVTVSEGVVAVSKAGHSTGKAEVANVTVSAGQQVTVRGASPLVVKHVNVASELAWADERLIFEGETAAEAVYEFNRRNRMQLEISDPTLAMRPVYGKFRVTEPESFAAVLAGETPVSILRERPGTLRIEPAEKRR